jgi:hypothetical protein
LFETKEIIAILGKDELNAWHDPEGLTGRGLLIGSKTCL